MNNATDQFYRIADAEAWAILTQIDVLLEYINNQDSLEAFEAYLAEKVAPTSHELRVVTTPVGEHPDPSSYKPVTTEGSTHQEAYDTLCSQYDDLFDRLTPAVPTQSPMWLDEGGDKYLIILRDWGDRESPAKPDVENVTLQGRNYMEVLGKVVEIAEEAGKCRLTLKVQQPQKAIGRNEQCPCGSGKKAKVCKCGLGAHEPHVIVRTINRAIYLPEDQPEVGKDRAVSGALAAIGIQAAGSPKISGTTRGVAAKQRREKRKRRAKRRRGK